MLLVQRIRGLIDSEKPVKLGGGLSLMYRTADDRYNDQPVLSMTRQSVRPSDVEVDTVISAFRKASN